MRNVNLRVLSGSDNANGTGTQIDANQLIAASFHAYFGDSTAAGTLSIQASNDIASAREVAAIDGFAVTHWVTVSTTSVSAGASKLVTLNPISYRWIRALWTDGAGVQTIQPIADVGALKVTQVTTVADVAGSLNSTFFTFSAKNSGAGSTNYYVWYDDGSGVDPAPGGTGIQVIYADDDAANAIATATRAAITSIAGARVTISGATNVVIITDKFMGTSTNAADGTAPTGFAFANTTAGAASTLNSSYFLLQDAASAHTYYVWMNINSQGVDPAVAGRTGVPIAVAAGASAATIGAALATAIAALNSSASFSASGTTTVTVTNLVAGTFVPMSDGAAPTHFTFAVTGGGTSTITVNMNALSM